MIGKNLCLLGLLVLLLFSSCRTDQDVNLTEGEEEIEVQRPEVLDFASFQGLVTDTDGKSIESAEVIIGNNSVFTTEAGYFNLRDKVNLNGTFVLVQHPDYFDAYANVLPAEVGITELRFRMKKKSFPGKISAQTGGELVIDNETQIEIPPNSFLNQDNSLYQGEVNLYVNHTKHLSQSEGDYFPGSLYGIDSDNQEVVIHSLGMMDIIATDSGGENLKLDKEIILRFEVSNQLESQVSSVIPLWHFNDTEGIWLQNGDAQLIDGKYYETSVAMDDLWCIGQSFVSRTLKGSVEFESNISGTKLIVQCPDLDMSMSYYLSNQGYYSLLVPEEHDLILEIYNGCQQVVYSESLGPNETIGPAPNISSNPASKFLLIGQAHDCEGELLEAGTLFIKFTSDNRSEFLKVEDGFVIGLLDGCEDESFSYQLFDEENNFLTESGELQIESVVDLGPIFACEFGGDTGVTIKYDDGSEYFIDNCLVTENPDSIPGQDFISYQFYFVDDQIDGQVYYELELMRYFPNTEEEQSVYFLITYAGEDAWFFDFGDFTQSTEFVFEDEQSIELELKDVLIHRSDENDPRMADILLQALKI